jgi:hypothetical protein
MGYVHFESPPSATRYPAAFPGLVGAIFERDAQAACATMLAATRKCAHIAASRPDPPAAFAHNAKSKHQRGEGLWEKL